MGANCDHDRDGGKREELREVLPVDNDEGLPGDSSSANRGTNPRPNPRPNRGTLIFQGRIESLTEGLLGRGIFIYF
jgi:hypothetical protein